MDVWRAISSQRAVRAFDGRPVGRDELARIVRAGRRAPSSKNEQRWSFVVVTDRDTLRRLAAVGPYAGHVAGAGAAVALLIPAADEGWQRESIAFDLGHCVQNMMLAAWELGIGSVHASVYEEPVAREILGYPDGWRCRYVVSFGYPADPSDLTRPPRRGGRKPLADVAHLGHWGGPFERS
jgi:nitroreductase